MISVSTFLTTCEATSFKANNDVKIGAVKNAYFCILKDDGTEISNYGDYSVESADKTKLLVTNTPLSTVCPSKTA